MPARRDNVTCTQDALQVTNEMLSGTTPDLVGRKKPERPQSSTAFSKTCSVPCRKPVQQLTTIKMVVGDSLRDARDICTLLGGATNTWIAFGNRIKCFQLASMLKKIVQ